MEKIDDDNFDTDLDDDKTGRYSFFLNFGTTIIIIKHKSTIELFL